jgi:hypothetical protein
MSTTSGKYLRKNITRSTEKKILTFTEIPAHQSDSGTRTDRFVVSSNYTVIIEKRKYNHMLKLRLRQATLLGYFGLIPIYNRSLMQLSDIRRTGPFASVTKQLRGK